MARKDQEDDVVEQEPKRKSIVETLLDKLALSTYGSSRDNDVDEMNDRFNKIIQDQLNKVTDNGENSLGSYLGILYADDKELSREIAQTKMLDQFQMNSSGTNPQDFFTDQYRNRMTRQALAQEISEQLIELRHAKKIMADIINSADSVTGLITRNLQFKNTTVTDPEKDYLPIIEAMEEKFQTLEKIRSFVTPNVLSYGEYYVYTIPYYHVFNEFIRKYRKTDKVMGGGTTRFYEAVDENTIVTEVKIEPLFVESAEEEPKPAVRSRYDVSKEKFYFEEELDMVKSYVTLDNDGEKVAKDDLTTLFTQRITVTQGEIPIPILEDGFDAYKDFCDMFVTEDGNFMEAGRSKTPVQRRKQAAKKKKNEEVMGTDEEVFLRKYGDDSGEGGFYHDKVSDEDLLTEEDIMDCYVKLIPPTRMLPIEMMGRTLFYLYIQTSSAIPLSTILSYNTQVKVKNPNNKIDVLLDDIADRVVKKFDKAFIRENKEFKKHIVAALEYYDISSTNIHFQVIPVDYITAYKVNVDVDGHGHSMLEPSLFYANCYLTMLIFKLMQIFTKSSDHTVNYIRRSGLDKNLWNDIQDIIRKKNMRRINVNDIFSFRNILNKVGSGSEEYIGMTRDGAKPIESEIVSGQDIQLDTPLMERLRQDMILSTEVPSAIMNFLNESDFAKSIETANANLNSTACAYQLCMNKGHTDWYRKLMRFSTKIPEEVISTFKFVLPEPKGAANVSTQEHINNYQTQQEFLLKLCAGENTEDEPRRIKFLQELAQMYLPSLQIPKVMELWEASALVSAKEKIGKTNGEDDDNF